MRFSTILEYQDKISVLTERNLNIIDEAKVQVRSLSEDETSEFTANKDEIMALRAEMADFERSMKDLEKNNNIKKISIDRNMEKKEFSFIRALSDAYNKGEKEVNISRAFKVTGVDGEGEDVVPVDLMNEVIMPLREEYVFGKAGAKIKTGLTGNIQLPVYTGNQGADHVEETGKAPEYKGSFTNITLTPKRISAYTTISKQFLIQAIPAAQDAIVEDLSRQIWDKIEANLFSSTAATETKPAGLLNGLSSETVETYKDLCDFEADLREKKYKNVKYIVSPRAEAAFKSTIKGTNGTGMIMTDGKVDGIETFVTSEVAPKQFLLGDFSNLVIGFWQNPTISFYDDFQLAQDGLVGIVVSGYYDAKLARPDAVALGEVAGE